MSISVLNTSSGVSAKTLVIAESPATITGLYSYNRGASAPFAVNAGAGKVTNLNAEMLDGFEGAAFLPLAGGTMTGDLLFTDALFDLGKSGATRPRDGFFSRNVAIGGTLGVTGVATFTAKPIISAGLQFPAVQVADAGANVLDDYEEEAWVPVIGGSGGTSGQTYTAQVGRYIKIGKLVIASCYVVLSGKGTITTNVEIQGLPFPSETLANLNQIGGSILFAALATNWISLVGFVQSASQVISINGIQAAGTSNANALATADITNTTQFMVTVMYRASA
jgi:hypothetical protein